MMRILLFLSLALVLFAGAPDNFHKAKRASASIYRSHLKSFYINADLISVKHKLTFADNPYTSMKHAYRGGNIEWEHVTPASWFVTADKGIYKAWKTGHPKCIKKGKKFKGRKCAGKVSQIFRKMEADMYNLVPANGALNALRSNNNFGIIPGEAREFGAKVDFEITGDIVEPMPSIRGDIARIMIYMHRKYGVIFPNHNSTMRMLDLWDMEDPEDEWEVEKRHILETKYGVVFY